MNFSTTTNFSELSANELSQVEGGIKATVDENGNIRDCLGRLVNRPDGGTIWVPHGATVFFPEIQN